MIEVAWLRALGAEGLERLLRLRPDVVMTPQPRSLGELADRLSASWSVVSALRQLDRPTLQVAEALAGLGGAAAKADLAQLLGNPQPRDLDRALSVLRDHALLAEGVVLALVPAAYAAWPSPLGLGPPVAQCLERHTVEQLRSIAARLGVAAGRRAEMLAAVTAAIRDPHLIRELVDRAPQPVRDELTAAAHSGEPIEFQPYLWHGSTGAKTVTSGSWGYERGLLTVADDGMDLVLVAEAALALRGPGYAAPFEPHQPHLPLADANQRLADDSGVAAIAALGRTVAAVHDAAGRKPVAILKAGGVGTREMKRLAKEVGCAEAEVRLALTLGYHMGMVQITDLTLVPTGRYDEWLAAEPSRQLAQLISELWAMPQLPLGEEGTWQPLHGPHIPELRRRILGEIPPGAAVLHTPAIREAVAWRYPYCLGDPETVSHFAEAAWREMELAGIVAAGAVTSAGKAMLAGEDVAATLTAVGGAQQHARFGTDLTAVVTGMPAAELARLLDGAAERESRGAASTWRFSQGSVRRAFDAGQTADGLIAALSHVAGAGLPQPLEYLIRDEARRHGSIRVRAAVSCLHSTDEALLQRLTADRKLVSLQLHRLTPTVVVCAKPIEETLAALRSAGYSPMPEDDGGVLITSPETPARAGQGDAARARRTGRVVRQLRPPEPDSPAEIAKRLLNAPDNAPAPENPWLEQMQAHASHLSPSEMRLLAHAIEMGLPVTIGYLDRQGQETFREIEQLDLIGGDLLAWCRLRDDLRSFYLGSIFSIRPAGE